MPEVCYLSTISLRLSEKDLFALMNTVGSEHSIMSEKGGSKESLHLSNSKKNEYPHVDGTLWEL